MIENGRNSIQTFPSVVRFLAHGRFLERLGNRRSKLKKSISLSPVAAILKQLSQLSQFRGRNLLLAPKQKEYVESGCLHNGSLNTPQPLLAQSHEELKDPQRINKD